MPGVPCSPPGHAPCVAPEEGSPASSAPFLSPNPKEIYQFMKLSLSLASLLTLGMLSTAALAQSAAPATSGPTRIAIIMFQPAVMQTNEGKRSIEQIETKYQPKQTQLKQESEELDTLKKQLQAQSATLSDADRAEKLKTIDDKTKMLQRDGEDAQSDFQQDMQQSYAQLAQKVFGTLQTYAKAHGYTVVLDASVQQSPVLYAAESDNITEAVIKAYNLQSGIAAPPPSAPAPSASAPTRRQQ
jgi:outer membrane protein